MVSAMKQSFELVYDEYYDFVYKYVYMILLNKEDTEDIVEETFISAYKAYEQYDSRKASVSTWLISIAHNKAVNLVRSAYYRFRMDMPREAQYDGEKSFINRIVEEEAIVRLYRELDSTSRELLNMRYMLGLKDSEVSEILGLPVKTINKRYQRLLIKCKEILEREKIWEYHAQ